MAYATAIFDLDGTLLNTLADLATATNIALAENGLPARTIDEVRRFVGNGIRLLCERAVPQGTPPELVDAVFDSFKRAYREHERDETVPYPGIPEMLHALRDAGVKVAVVSNKADFAVQALVAHYFGDVFHFALGEREGTPKKPDRAMVDLILAELGETADGMVYVGDSEVDIETAANCGCDCIICSWGFREREQLVDAGARTIVDTPEELLNAILRG